MTLITPRTDGRKLPLKRNLFSFQSEIRDGQEPSARWAGISKADRANHQWRRIEDGSPARMLARGWFRTQVPHAVEQAGEGSGERLSRRAWRCDFRRQASESCTSPLVIAAVGMTNRTKGSVAAKADLIGAQRVSKRLRSFSLETEFLRAFTPRVTEPAASAATSLRLDQST